MTIGVLRGAVQGVGAALEESAALAVLDRVLRGAERSRAFAFCATTVVDAAHAAHAVRSQPRNAWTQEPDLRS